jgi:hypothetical protein
MKRTILSGLASAALAMSYSVAVAQDNASAGSPMVILKKMSDNMASKPSFSLSTTSIYDEKFEDQLIKSMVTHRVDIVRPSTLYVEAIFDDGEKWLGAFDGKMLRYYEPAEKEYSEIPFEGSIDDLVDKLDASGLTQTPLNDFLRNDFYADVEPGIFEATLVDGYVDPRDGNKKTSHLLFQSPGTVWQLWVERGNYNLPRRLVVTYTEIGRPEYSVTFDDWNFDVKPEELAKKYNIPTSFEGWTKVDFVNPVNFK